MRVCIAVCASEVFYDLRFCKGRVKEVCKHAFAYNLYKVRFILKLATNSTIPPRQGVQKVFMYILFDTLYVSSFYDIELC